MNYDFLNNESKLLKKGIDLVNKRRLYWDIFEIMAIKYLEGLCKEAKKENINLYIFTDKVSEDRYSKFVQLSFGSNLTGTKNFRQGDTFGNHVIESGCTLLYSQGMDGKIAVIFYPFKSELSKPLKEYYIYTVKDPSKLSEKEIEGHVKILFSYAHYSSFSGLHNIFNYLKYTKLRLYSIVFKLKNEDWLENIITTINKIASRAIASNIA